MICEFVVGGIVSGDGVGKAGDGGEILIWGVVVERCDFEPYFVT